MDSKIDTVREAFEQWCLRENGKWAKKVIERHDDGRYCVLQTYMDWSAWQAGYSAALSTIDPEAIRRECADRAAIWLAELHGVEPDPALPWSKKLMRIRALQSCTLRAAILGAEPAKDDRKPEDER